MRSSLALVVFALVFVMQDVRGQDAKAIVKKFDALITSFPHYQCRYELTQGEATVDEKTQVIQWKSKSSAECRYAVDGEYEAFEQFGNARPDLSKKPPPTKEGSVSFVKVEGFPNEKLIRGPAGHGDWMDVFGNLTLTPRARISGEKPVFAPLDFDFCHRCTQGPAKMLALSDMYTVTELGTREIAGRPCVGLRFEAAEYRQVLTVWFDPGWGMMPVWQDDVQESQGRRTVYRFVVTAARELSNGRWFPEREIRYEPGKTAFVLEYKLKEVNADTRPTKDQLSVVLPTGTHIRSDEVLPSTPTKHFTFRQDEKVSGHDIEELFDKLSKVKPGKSMDPALRHDSDRRSLWFWVCGGAGLLLVLFGGYRWLRKRSASRSALPGSGSP